MTSLSDFGTFAGGAAHAPEAPRAVHPLGWQAPPDLGGFHFVVFLLMSGPLALVLALPVGLLFGWSVWGIVLGALATQSAASCLVAFVLVFHFWLSGGFAAGGPAPVDQA